MRLGHFNLGIVLKLSLQSQPARHQISSLESREEGREIRRVPHIIVYLIPINNIYNNIYVPGIELGAIEGEGR